MFSKSFAQAVSASQPSLSGVALLPAVVASGEGGSSNTLLPASLAPKPEAMDSVSQAIASGKLGAANASNVSILEHRSIASYALKEPDAKNKAKRHMPFDDSQRALTRYRHHLATSALLANAGLMLSLYFWGMLPMGLLFGSLSLSGMLLVMQQYLDQRRQLRDFERGLRRYSRPGGGTPHPRDYRRGVPRIGAGTTQSLSVQYSETRFSASLESGGTGPDIANVTPFGQIPAGSRATATGEPFVPVFRQPSATK